MILQMRALLLVAIASVAHAADWQLTSDGEKLHLRVDTRGPVEVSLATLPTSSEYLHDENGTLYLIDGKADLKAMLAEAKNPSLVGCGDDSDDHEELERAKRLLFDDRHFSTARAVFGVVRFSLQTDGRVLAIRDDYPKEIPLGPIERAIRSTVAQTPGGYRIEADISPEGLGYSPREGISTVAVRIGGSRTVTRVALARPLRPEFASGLRAPLSTVWPKQYAWNGNGWSAVSRDVVGYSTGWRCDYYAKRISSVSFQSRPIGAPVDDGNFRRWPLGTEAHGDLADTIISVAGRELQAGEYLSSFQFADGTPGALIVDWSTEGYANGMCGAAPVAHIRLARFSTTPTKVDIADVDACRHLANIGDLSLEGLADDEANYAIHKAIAWKKVGRSLLLTLAMRDSKTPLRLHIELAADGSVSVRRTPSPSSQ
jgi:hypothetical protein